MTKDQFGKEMDRLRNVYSASSLSPERIEVLWANFKSVPSEQFHTAVNFLIGEFTTQALPSVSKFFEAVAKFRREPNERNVVSINRHPACQLCNRSGYVVTKTRSTPRYEVLFKCSCPAGVEFRARAHVWDMSKHFDEYELIPPYGDAGRGIEENPKAKELADYYVPRIRELMAKVGKPLPYDPSKSIAKEDGVIA